MTLWDAQAEAQHYQEQATRLRALGGVGYKTGQVQRAEANAAKYSAMVQQLEAPIVLVRVPSPESEHYAQVAARYRAMGGVAYKTGQLQRAEAEQRKAEALEWTVAAAPTPPTPPSCLFTKLALRTDDCALL